MHDPDADQQRQASVALSPSHQQSVRAINAVEHQLRINRHQYIAHEAIRNILQRQRYSVQSLHVAQ